MKALDVLVFIPLIPMLPVIAAWFLPWEDWIPKGPYLLYCAFGAWYFKAPWWLVAGLYGVVVCVIAILGSKPQQ